MEVQVAYRGKTLEVEGLENTTPVGLLKKRLEELTKVPVANQKLIFKGKTLPSDDDSLEVAGIVSKAKSARGASGEAKFTQEKRLMLVGSTASEVQVVHKLREDAVVRNDLEGVAIPKGYKKVALNIPSGPPAHSPYRFEGIETLPGLPNEDRAREILESLADDPGVRSVLEKHKWTVGALCELYPEGKVGISATCVMGLNVNHGEKIRLRLRTDDLKGFRKILSIRKVLFHELAHNEFSEHDDNFYQLMRQVEREAAELDWRRQTGRTLAGRELAGLPGNERGYILVKEAFEGGSGRLGGESEALTHLFSAQQLAGQAAMLRLTPEEQEIEDCCGHSTVKEDSAVAASEGTHKCEGELASAGDTARGVEEEKDELGGAEAGNPGGDNPMDIIEPTEMVLEEATTQEDMSEEVMGGVTDPVRSNAGRRGRAGGATVEAIGDSATGFPSPMEVTQEKGNAPFANDPPAPQQLLPLPSTAPGSPLDELVAMGFARDAADEALYVSGGSVAEAASRLLAPGLSSVGVGGAGSNPSDEAFSSSGRTGMGERPRLSREVRVQQATEKIAGHNDRGKALKCLEVLEAMLRNILEHPAEEKFRRVRRSNGKFKASVGSVTGGVELLLAAGFDVQGTDQLKLGRQDPGLIWLARTTVEGWRERLAT